jgi:hypothetical protein
LVAEIPRGLASAMTWAAVRLRRARMKIPKSDVLVELAIIVAM